MIILKQESILQTSLLKQETGSGQRPHKKKFIKKCILKKCCLFRPEIYSHITCATDAENVKFVFAAVKHRILSKIMEEMFNNSVIID